MRTPNIGSADTSDVHYEMVRGHAEAMKVQAIMSQIASMQAAIELHKAAMLRYGRDPAYHHQVARAHDSISNLVDRIREASDNICAIHMAAAGRLELNYPGAKV